MLAGLGYFLPPVSRSSPWQESWVKLRSTSPFKEVWSVKKSSIVLAISTVFVAIMSEYLVHSIAEATASCGMTEVFVGVIIVAIVGNAAEHSAAIMMAMKNKMDIAVTIAIGSSSQVALLLAPVLVFLSYFVGPEPMDLVFSPLEVLAAR
jgi:Ca2+:H+ antiporter